MQHDALEAIQVAADEVALIRQQLDAAVEKRNQAIVAARMDGYTWGRLMEVSGLARMTIHEAALRANGGKTPVPRTRQR